MRIRNVNPVGGVDVPLLRRTVPEGEVVEVSEQHARVLLEQTVWEPADADAEAVLAVINAVVAEEAARAEAEAVAAAAGLSAEDGTDLAADAATEPQGAAEGGPVETVARRRGRRAEEGTQ